MMLLLLAQLPGPTPDPIAGWGQFLLQLGSFGLVCYIVAIAFPKWQREHCDEKDQMRIDHHNTIAILQVGFRERADELVKAVDRQTDTLGSKWDSHALRVEKAISTVCRNNPPGQGH